MLSCQPRGCSLTTSRKLSLGDRLALGRLRATSQCESHHRTPLIALGRLRATSRCESHHRTPLIALGRLRATSWYESSPNTTYCTWQATGHFLIWVITEHHLLHLGIRACIATHRSKEMSQLYLLNMKVSAFLPRQWTQILNCIVSGHITLNFLHLSVKKIWTLHILHCSRQRAEECLFCWHKVSL